MMINENEQQYLTLAQYVLDHGHQKGDRTGTGTLSRLDTKCGLTCKRASRF